MSPIPLSYRKSGRLLLCLFFIFFFALSGHTTPSAHTTFSCRATPFYIDPGSRHTWDSLVRLVCLENKRLIKEIRRLERINSRHDSSMAWAEPRSLELLNRQYRLDSILKNLKQLRKSEIKYQITLLPAGHEEGFTCYDQDTKGINFNVGSVANFVHETTHGIQFERRQLAYDTTTGDAICNDTCDEKEAYVMQFAFDSASIAILHSSSVATAPSKITGIWVINLIHVKDKAQPYSLHGSAHLALNCITVNAGRAEIIDAYRYIEGIKTKFQSDYKFTTDSKVFYKHIEEKKKRKN
ncbi:MAG TPA: hypothetical protein VI233_12450 [Puia sp.]